MTDFRIENISADQNDASGNAILAIYTKVVPLYAVYRTKERVVIQYADDPELGKKQRGALSSLNPTRGEINGLIDGWRISKDVNKQSKAKLFDRRVADALICALEGDSDIASKLLNKIKDDVVAERTSAARGDYVIVAGATAALLILIVWVVTKDWWPIHVVFKNLWPMAGFGALGALFSIALTIRERSILTDLQNRENGVDAVLRVLIGAMSAVILYSLLRADLVDFKFGTVQGNAIFTGTCKPQDICSTPGQYMLIVIAFLAGFSERMVSDLLKQASVSVRGGVNPLAGGDPAKPAVQPLSPVGAPAGTPPAASSPPPDDAAEGCLSDAADDPGEHTSDAELPEATGGVATAATDVAAKSQGSSP